MKRMTNILNRLFIKPVKGFFTRSLTVPSIELLNTKPDARQFNGYITISIRTTFKVLVLLSILALPSCSTTKSLQQDELLYTGADIKIKGKHGSQLKDYKSPEPNKRILGFIPFKLWIYNMVQDSVPDKGFRHWLKYKIGEPPVIYEYYFAGGSVKDMQNHLFNKGYFDARSGYEEKIKKQKIEIIYNIEPKSSYKLERIVFPDSINKLTGIIDSIQKDSYLKVGKGYDLEKLKRERVRINDVVRDRGYYYFSPDMLIFKIDSNYSEKKLDVYLQLKKDIPKKDLITYYLDSINVYADYSIENKDFPADSVYLKGYNFVFHEDFLKPVYLVKAIALKKGHYYRFSDYSATLNKVMGLGVYKFANVRFNESGVRNDSAMLNTEVYLTRTIPRSLRLELQAVSKSNDFAGPGFQASYQDRNLLRGAENLSVNFNAGFETQIAQKQNALNSLQFGIDGTFRIPRFVFPFVDVNKYLSKSYTPSTLIKGGYSFYDRSKLFIMNSLNLSFGYSWKETETKSHDLNLLNADYSKLSRTSAQFDSILQNNPLVKESFSEQFIVSLSYRYTYNNQRRPDKMVYTYFQNSNELAGNTINLARSIFGGNTQADGRRTFLGIPYAQYARTTGDFVGIPYGNSSALPYKKQFYIGGASSVRAFQYRSVGPGSYSPDSDSRMTFFDQTGDIKLESNLEYRFTIYKLVKGGMFLDAGNIWLINDDPAKPGGKFAFSSILDETAVGTGFGLRFDASFFVLRFDVGMPLRKPFMPQGERWVIDDINFSGAKWRRNNLVLNIAIGYPF